MVINLRNLLTSSIFAFGLAAGAVACNGVQTEDELVVGEGTAALMSSEEGEEIGGDAVAAMSEADVSADATEAADATPDPTAADTYAPCDFEAKKAELRAIYDTNSNGVLDEDEKAALRADLDAAKDKHPRFARAVKHFRKMAFGRVKWAFDQNGDGTLDETERAALVDAMESRCTAAKARIVEKFDTNGDGQLSKEELQAARADFRARLKAKHDAILADYDTNQNGVLDPLERQQLRADVHAALRQRVLSVKQSYDTNANGVLDPDEIAQLKADIRERVASGRPEDGTAS
jgi:Ca2+-binding EF-hand superfamily protein